MIKPVMALALMAGIAAGPAQGASLSFSNAESLTPISQNGLLALFDTNIGILQSVRLTLVGTGSSTFTLTNTAGISQDATATSRIPIYFSSPLPGISATLDVLMPALLLEASTGPLHGELRITLTGMQGLDYAKLADRPEVVVLQMANPDVTDATLEHLRELTRLRRLDVGNSQVSDAGLATIAALPALEELNLGHTKITDAGFQQHLMSKASLHKLDLTATEVKGKTKRDWKNKQPDRRDYVD